MPNISDFDSIKRFGGERELQLAFALAESVPEDGMVAEFGVFSGTTINYLAACLPNRVIHGFDSFQGLPEPWARSATDIYRPGHFDTKGMMPAVRINVRLHPGWFKDTLPGFLAVTPGPFRFINIDSDIYSSARTVLDLCGPRLGAGSVIHFDEYCDWGGGQKRYPLWPQGEFKALNDWCAEFKRVVEPLSRNSAYGAVVRVKE